MHGEAVIDFNLQGFEAKLVIAGKFSNVVANFDCQELQMSHKNLLLRSRMDRIWSLRLL